MLSRIGMAAAPPLVARPVRNRPCAPGRAFAMCGDALLRPVAGVVWLRVVSGGGAPGAGTDAQRQWLG